MGCQELCNFSTLEGISRWCSDQMQVAHCDISSCDKEISSLAEFAKSVPIINQANRMDVAKPVVGAADVAEQPAR